MNRLTVLSLLFLSGWFWWMAMAPLHALSQPSAPDFSHLARTYLEPFDLHFTVEDGATVHYEIGGAVPTSNSPEYSEDNPLRISGSVLVRARAFDSQGNASESVTRMFIRLDKELEDFSSDIPVVIVNEHDETMVSMCEDDPPESGTNCERTLIHFTVIDVGHDGRTHLLTDDFHVHERSHSNYRGQSSMRFPKRQFGVRLLDEEDENRNVSILGMPSENNWIMHAPWDDRTLMRNAVAYQLSRDMGRYSPRTRFVELFKHNGNGPVTMSDYHGVYMLVERIKWDDNRVDIAKLTENDNQEPEITGGYILNHDDHETHVVGTTRNTRFRLVRPQDNDITPQQRDWIENYIGKLEAALFGDDFTDPEVGYAAYLEPESFIDYHLITEGLKEMDGYRKSTYMYKDRDSRMVMGPLWDWNISMGNTRIGRMPNSCEPTGWYYEDLLKYGSNGEERYLNGWYTRLFEDPAFSERYRERWWELRRGALESRHIENVMRKYAAELDEAQRRNYERWPELGKRRTFNCVAFNTYEEEVEYMIDWTLERLEWVDKQLGPPKEYLSGDDLRYFWYIGTEIPNDTPLQSLDASYALGNRARIQFHSALDGYPFHDNHSHWRKASMERRNRPTDINYWSEGNLGRPYRAESMRALQIRQPFRGDGGENMLVFEVPTDGVTDGIVFRFAVMDEGAADRMLVDYAIEPAGHDDNSRWRTTGMASHEIPLSPTYERVTLDFRDIPEVKNNPDFRIRIRFDGDRMSDDSGNRVTFNNFSLEALDESREVSVTPPDAGSETPSQLDLSQNYPNPFNPSTTIRYALPEASDVRIIVYNILGQRIRTLVDGRREAGSHSVVFDASDLAGGAYIYELRAHDQRITRTMMLVK
jgi:hypothetical protein